MSQLFMHGIQGLVRGEVEGEEGAGGMSGLPSDITLRLPEAVGREEGCGENRYIYCILYIVLYIFYIYKIYICTKYTIEKLLSP